MRFVESETWSLDWMWSLPLVVLGTVIHVLGLGLITAKATLVLGAPNRPRRFVPTFAVAMGLTVLLAAVLHWVEAVIWAGTYRLLSALPDYKTAMLYSLGAMTTYGHANLFLEPRWHMMGTIESLNGMILFGLTTAFLFAMIQRIWLVSWE